jgi:hypothetical protein
MQVDPFLDEIRESSRVQKSMWKPPVCTEPRSILAIPQELLALLLDTIRYEGLEVGVQL